MKKFASILLSVITLAATSIALSPSAQAANPMAGNVAKVSFTFDDGFKSTYTQAAPTLAKYGLIGTSFPITSCVGTPKASCPVYNFGFMNWTQIKALQNTYKWEVGSHTNTHPAMTTLTAAKVAQELNSSQVALTNRGLSGQAYCSPYGDYNPKVISAIAKKYSSHRGFADIGYNSFPYNDYLLYVQQVQVGVSVAQVKSYVDYAKANNLWLILAFHDISPQPSADPEDFQYSVSDLDAIAAYVKQQGLPAPTISQGLVSSASNLMPNSTFNSGLSEGWTTDAPASVVVNANNNGSFPSATKSLSITGGAQPAHIFSPKIAVSNAQQYVIKGYLNVTQITTGAVGFYIDEYDAAGNWISGQYKAQENSVFAENLNFVYQPSSANVAKASLQIFTTAGSNAKAFIDNVVWFGEAVVTPPVEPPVEPPAAVNLLTNPDFDSGLTNGWTTDVIANILADATGQGAAPSTASSILLTANATKNAHLFGPKIDVTSSSSYTVSGYLNILQRASGGVGFYIDEYDAAGNWISGQYKTERTALGAGTTSFSYQPSSSNVAKASLQVIVDVNSGIRAFLDHAVWTKN